MRLDVYVEDETGRVYDIEMQCENEANNGLAKRTRYYQGMIDMELLNKGDVYDNLKPSYIIFICTFDAFAKGQPMYTFRNRCVEEDGLELNDEATKIFLNSKGDSEMLDPDVRAFLRYVDGKAAEGNFMKAVEAEVMRVKEHKETRREYMTYAMEIKRRELAKFQEGREEGRQAGEFCRGGKNGREKRGKKERTDDDIGDAAEGIFRREHCRMCANLGRIYHGIREKESFAVI